MTSQSSRYASTRLWLIGPMSAQKSDNCRQPQGRDCRVLFVQNQGHATNLSQYTWASTQSSAPHAFANSPGEITELMAELLDMMIARLRRSAAGSK